MEACTAQNKVMFQQHIEEINSMFHSSKMDTMYPTALSRHKSDCSPPQRYKRTVKKKVDRRGRFRTQPITFMEIKVEGG